jgi:hypothetical protein
MDIRPQYHIAALSTITAIWSALRYELLTPKTDATVPTVTTFCVNPYLVNEHSLNREAGSPAGAASERNLSTLTSPWSDPRPR